MRLASLLVEKRLAACVNIAPGIESVYRWKDAIERAEEVLLLIKTSRELFEKVKQALATAHSYEVPEIVALPIVDGSESYLSWLSQPQPNYPVL
jgi:periplasmic divalent cation tolerance protein